MNFFGELENDISYKPAYKKSNTFIYCILIGLIFAVSFMIGRRLMKNISRNNKKQSKEDIIELIQSPTCGFCIKQIQYLKDAGILHKFKLIDIKESKYQIGSVPTFVKNGTIISSGYTENLDDILN